MPRNSPKNSILGRFFKFDETIFGDFAEYFSAKVFVNRTRGRFVMTLGSFGDIIPFTPRLFRDAKVIAQIHMWGLITSVVIAGGAVAIWHCSPWYGLALIVSLFVVIFHVRELILYFYVHIFCREYLSNRKIFINENYKKLHFLDKLRHHQFQIISVGCYLFYMMIFNLFSPRDNPSADAMSLLQVFMLLIGHGGVLMHRRAWQRLTHRELLGDR